MVLKKSSSHLHQSVRHSGSMTMEDTFEPDDNKPYDDITTSARGEGDDDDFSFCQFCQSRARRELSSGGKEISSGRREVVVVVGLKLLRRYLNVSSPEGTGGGGGGGGGEGDASEEMVESLCQACCSLVADFLEAYKEFENSRLRLWNCLSLLQERMGNGGGGGESNEKFMKQCHLKLTSLPKVSVMRTAEPSKASYKRKRIKILVKRERESSSVQNCKNDSGGRSQECNRRRGEEEEEKNGKVKVKTEAGSDMEWEPATPDLFENETSHSSEGGDSEVSEDESILQPFMTTTPKARDVKGLLTCTHCSHVSRDPREHQNHVLSNHPIEFLDEDLKPGTTKEELENAIQQLIHGNYSGLGVDKKCGKDYKCKLCGSLCDDAFEQRAHYLEMHVDSILAILNAASDDKSNKKGLESPLENGGRRKSKKKRKQTACTFCGFLSSTCVNSREHMMIHHPTSYFKDQIIISQGQEEEEEEEGVVTDEDIGYAVAEMFREGLVVSIGGNVRTLDCKICGGVRRGDTRRIHMFKYHLDLVLSRAGSSSSSSSSTLKNNTNSAVGVPGSGLKKKVLIATTVKPDHHKEWERQNGMEMGTACLYCKAVFTKVSRNRKHMLSCHTLQYLHLHSKGVREMELEQAIESICSTKRVKNVTGEKCRVDCGICKKVQVVQSKRQHILQKHSELLVSSLPGDHEDGDGDEDVSKKPQRDRGEGARRCHVCKKLITKGKLMAHLKTHKKTAPIKTIKCSHCPHTATDLFDARAHMLTNHTLVVLEPQLRSCGAVGVTPHLLEEALNQVIAAGQVQPTPNRTKRNQYSCLLCPEGKCLTNSKRRHVLQTHRDRVIVNVQKLLKEDDNESDSPSTLE